MSSGGDEPPWSLQAGIDAQAWPPAAREATDALRQGMLVRSPPLVYAADPAHPIHAATKAWAPSPVAASGVVNVLSEARRPPYGLTQTCDLVEEGTPKRPWIHLAPVYELTANRGERRMVEQGRGFDYLVHVTGLAARGGALWVADLRLLVPAEKGWLVGREVRPGFSDEEGYDRLAAQLARRFSRPAYATVVVEQVLKPLSRLVKAIIERYEGKDQIADIGIALGRSPLDPVNAELVFLLDGPLPPGLREQIIEWWQPTGAAARAAGLELLAPRFVSLDELSAREYRALDLLDAASMSPEPEPPFGEA